ncbi:MAG: zf-HC2 domain-containing protein [Acidobacteriota bacterium]|nr:zf-HC2 domain-containing protein [Acidobacteriota bacterium]
MHKPIRDHLEAYLRNSTDATIPEEFSAHLAACSSCQEQLQAVTGHSQQLRAFRNTSQVDTSQVEPKAGFYARVLNRIEEQKPDSFWSVFLGPVLGSRLAYSCAALVLVLGTYLVTSEPRDQIPPAADVISSQLPAAHDRDAVLVNLVSYQE